MAKLAKQSTLYADIVRHAQERPAATAVIDGPKEINYAQFANDIDQVSRRLRKLKLPRDAVVAISVAPMYLHWLVLIGLWRNGIASVSVGRNDLAFDLENFGAKALVLDHDLEVPFAGTSSRVDADWLIEDSAAYPAFVDPVLRHDHLLRLTKSSGTTGLSKRTAFTKNVIDARLDRVKRNPRFNASVCFMSLVGVLAVEFFFSVGAWSVGGAVEFPSQPIVDALEKGELKAGVVFMNTTQLRDIVNALPSDRLPNRSLIVLVGGSVVPREVYTRALQRLAGTVMIVYGSTEAGTVAINPNPLQFSEPGVCGFVVPDMEVQIINDAGHPVGEGIVGEVRIRSTSCVAAYVDDPAASASAFRDDWFYPGDLGRLSKIGLLTVLGRVDEIMNIGGWKVSPAAIEEHLAGCGGVRDMAACAVPDVQGLDQLWIVVVRGEGFLQDELVTLLRQSGGPVGASFNVLYLSAIPRNAMGKVQRAELVELVKKNRPERANPNPSQHLPELRNGGSILRIENTDFDVNLLVPAGLALAKRLQFVEAELQRLKTQVEIYQATRTADSQALNNMFVAGTLFKKAP